MGLVHDLLVMAMREMRAAVSGVLVRAALVVFVLLTGVILMVAGVFRLADAVALACGRLVGDPAGGLALGGLVLIALPLLVLWLLARRWRRG